MSVRVCVYKRVCVCVCERERERECVCVCVRQRQSESVGGQIIIERERERLLETERHTETERAKYSANDPANRTRDLRTKVGKDRVYRETPGGLFLLGANSWGGFQKAVCNASSRRFELSAKAYNTFL